MLTVETMENNVPFMEDLLDTTTTGKNSVYDDANRIFTQAIQLVSYKTKDVDLVATLEISSADMVYAALVEAYRKGYADAKKEC